jgi:hypothetical protein
MLEKDIVSAIMRYLRTIPHCFCWKQHGGLYGTSGLPDVVACINGRFVAFEVKTPAGRLTMLQKVTLQKINNAKGAAFKVTGAEEVKGIVKKLMTEWGETGHEQ